MVKYQGMYEGKANNIFSRYHFYILGFYLFIFICIILIICVIKLRK